VRMEGDEWLFSFNVQEGDEDDESEEYMAVAHDAKTLASIMTRIRERDTTVENQVDWTFRRKLIATNMGSLKLCQLDRGTLLRESGALQALVATLFEVEDQKTEPAAADLSVVCWGALRDLSCGDQINRAMMREIQVDGANVLQLLVKNLERYNHVFWKDMNPQDLSLVTILTGVLRNVTHWTPRNCEILHKYGVTDLLVWRLLHASGAVETALPENGTSWREASYRCSNTLINMADEYEPCALEIRKNSLLVDYLVAEWSSNKRLSSLFKFLTENNEG